MTSAIRQLDVRRIYSVRSGAAAPVAVGARATGRFTALGTISLLTAALWTYLAWWPADRLILTNLMTASLNHLSASGGMLGLEHVFARAPEGIAGPAPPDGTTPFLAPPAGTGAGEFGPAASGDEPPGMQAMAWLAGDMYAWLTVTTVVGIWLAFCGGAALAGAPFVDGARRRPVIIAAVLIAMLAAWMGSNLWDKEPLPGLSETSTELLFAAAMVLIGWLLVVALPPRSALLAGVVLMVALAGGGALTWLRLETGYPTAAPRIAAAVGLIIAGLFGTVARRRVISLHRVAVVFILVATVTTLVALKVADSHGGIQSHHLTFTTYAGIAGAQLSFAAILAGALALRARLP